MYLTKIELSIRSQSVRAALRNTQKMHQLVTGFFGKQRKDADILFRSYAHDAVVDLYIYSLVPVDQSRIPQGMKLVSQKDMTPWLEGIKNGSVFEFLLDTAPFKKLSDAATRNNRRRALQTVKERAAWLDRKAKQNGFQILSMREKEGKKVTAYHMTEKGGELTIGTWAYAGYLAVTNADAFKLAVEQGIGPGKAYGMGMLLLMEASCEAKYSE